MELSKGRSTPITASILLPVVSSGTTHTQLAVRRRLFSSPFARILWGVLVIAGLRKAAQWYAAWQQMNLRRYLTISTPLQGTSKKQACPCGPKAKATIWPWSSGPDWWQGFCPTCKRPVDLYLAPKWGDPALKYGVRGKYAFLICLWGASPHYVLGALVLGYSIKRTGSRHARVCCYTDDVPHQYVELLSTLWEMRLVKHIDAQTRVLAFADNPDRFDKVFTKLNAMSLVDFEKVLMMDIDLLVRSSIDELFDFQAPAALKRGMSEWQCQTGEKIEGRPFFLGKESNKWSWGQGTGINAGVMLLKPDKRTFDEMVEEIGDASHPSHIRGNGPEQDYLSRYFADAPWTQIGVAYNFQLHQMFYALHPDKIKKTQRATILAQPDQIKIVHYSGDNTAKPWHRVLDERWAEFWPDRSRDAEYKTLFADEFSGHRYWVKRDRDQFEAAVARKDNWDLEGMWLDSDMEFYRRSSWNNHELEHLEVPEATVRAAMDFLDSALTEWFDTLQALERELGIDLKQKLLSDVPSHVGEVPAVNTDWTPVSKDIPAAGLHQTNVSQKAGALPGRRSRQAGETSWFWRRYENGMDSWWTEGLTTESTTVPASNRASVVCGGLPGRRFVTFTERCEEVFESSGAELSGIFIKIVGPTIARQFELPCGEEVVNEDQLVEKLGHVSLFVAGVPFDATVLVALVGLEQALLGPTLEALSPLGIPRCPPSTPCVAFAAVGRCQSASADSDTGSGPQARTPWFGTHASLDVAYASAPLPP